MIDGPNQSMLGRQVALSDEGEGWFDGYAQVGGTVEAVLQPDPGGNPCYVVRLEPPLAIQEAGAPTPSGLALRHYSHCVLHCRWRGFEINADTSVSVQVLLVPAGAPRPRSVAEVATMQIKAWASCVVAPASRT